MAYVTIDSVVECVVCCAMRCSVLQCVAAVYCSVCSVLQCVAVCCSVLQCVAVCCSVLQCVANSTTESMVKYTIHIVHIYSPLPKR